MVKEFRGVWSPAEQDPASQENLREEPFFVFELPAFFVAFGGSQSLPHHFFVDKFIRLAPLGIVL